MISDSLDKFIKENNITSCKLPCPINQDSICYRWDLCIWGREFIKEGKK
jgi:hypothetical protein